MTEKYTAALQDSLNKILAEIERAKKKHPGDFNSLHEAYGVIKEKFDELWDEIKMKDPDYEKIKTEAVQTAAMLLRLIVELA